MTPDQFTSAAIALVRTAVGWQEKIAKLLECNPKRVRQWMAKGEIPSWVPDKMAALMGLAEKDRLPWPRDEWLVGWSDDPAPRRYVSHLAPPRFIARVVEIDEDTGEPAPHEHPADVVTGTVYQADVDCVLAEIAWQDEPRQGEVTQLLEAAADAVERVEDFEYELRNAKSDDYEGDIDDD